MIQKVIIKNNKNTPIKYISNLESFKDGTEYHFKSGVNIIVGKNGCGKTTLLKLIEIYLMIDKERCGKGLFNSNINRIFRGKLDGEKIANGVDVYADYTKNTFRLCHIGEKSNDDALKDFNSFGVFATQLNSSTGEGVIVALNALFSYMFGKGAELYYDYNQFKERHPSYVEYVDKHRVDTDDAWTILMDEPDRNLDIDMINQIKDILSYHKPQTQIIAVVHNPLLIYSLSNNKDINFIEMTEGYIDNVINNINKLLQNDR